MKTWNIGNTTVRNPERIADALRLFLSTMQGRPFHKPEQNYFQDVMIDNGLVRAEKSDKPDYASGARKFASAFKQLGFITDWNGGKAWTPTPVGRYSLARNAPTNWKKPSFCGNC